MMKVKRSLTRQRSAKPSASDRIHSDALTHMYYDDWTSDILPFVYHDAGKKFQVRVIPEAQRLFIRDLFNTRGPENETPEESLSEFVKEVGQCLILYGGAAFELCEVEDNKKIKHVLNSVPFEALKLTDAEVIQTVTDDSGQQDIYRVDKTKVLLIEAPAWIEGGSGFKNTIESLLGLSRQEFSPLKFLEKQSLGETTFFDLSKFRNFQEVEVLHETLHSGWLGRGLYTARMTEFYYLIRYLRFKRAQAQLRAYLLDSINRFLAGIEKHGLPKTSLVVEGLPSLAEIDKLTLDLEAGSIGFLEIVSRFKGV